MNLKAYRSKLGFRYEELNKENYIFEDLKKQ